MTMANAALAYANLFDLATLAASSAASAMPVANLQAVHVASKWRGTGGTTDSFTATWSANQTADTFAVIGLGATFLSTGTVRLQLTSSGGAAGDVYDSTAQAGVVDPNYGYAIHLLTPRTFRSATWTFAQAGASYIEAGRAFVGTRTVLTYNYAPGAQRTMEHGTRKAQSEAGQTYVNRRFRRRVEEFSLDWIDEAQRWALHEALDIANGDHTDVLLIKDTADSNLGRATVWGLLDQVSPVTQPFSDAALFSRAYKIVERL